jgi:hypothetical protein
MRKRVFWVLGGAVVAIGSVAAVAHLALAGGKVQVGRPCADADRPSLAGVDHAPFDVLLHKYVDGRGMVAYAAWKANADDVQALDDYLARLGCVDLHKPAPKAARLAFWINAYNAVTLRGILREYPTSSIRNHTAKLGGYNIWKDLYLWVDGGNYCLDDIEHKVLRKMGQPLIHFAIVCASHGCPPLWHRAYTAAGLDLELAANARRFFADPANFRADPANATLYFSQLLQWYGGDFAATSAERARRLRPYLPSPDGLGWVEAGNVQVKYLDYDWRLNDQSPPSP